MENISVGKERIKTLWNWCEERKFAVPEIQREFVWDRRRASAFLDSIYRKLPIGSLLIWETRGDHRQLLRHSQVLLPPHDPANSSTLFLIDGQQRLSVLYRARHGGSVINSNGVEINFDQLCFNLLTEEGESNFLFTRRPIAGQQIPVMDILSPEWRRKVRRLSKWKRKKIRNCRTEISRYLFPVIRVRTNNLEEVRESFLRINSGGLRISKADRAFSKASRLDLRRLVRELRESLPHGFNQVDPRILQVALAVIQGQKDTGSQAVESAITKLEKAEFQARQASRQFTRKWKNISNCAKRAVDYLNNELGVINFSFLPSELMIAVLAFFFYANNQAQPNARQRKEIRKWFWATGVGRRYVGRGYYINIRHDLDFFQRLGRRREGRFNYRDRMSFAELRRTDYTSGGSLEIAFWLMLSKRKPCYLESGVPMPLEGTASVANRKDKHHIFPRALLERNDFTAREANSLANMCYLVAEENQSIGSNKPAVYLEDYKRLKHFPRVMRSHLIPYRSDSALWNRNVRSAYRKFVRQRIDLIRRAFEKEAGTRLFRRD
ncbi:MAG: DUF262 domain-containing protein [Chitinispirillaceae bacterium]|nr:DUF262 domain-containing protein [Chitinispirillaceae bacterium]